MNRILFKMELRRNARSLVIWSVVIGLLIFFTMSLFRSVLQYQQQISGMVQVIPAVAIKIRGFSSFSDLFSVMGFYIANNAIYMMLLGSIFAIALSSNILLKEEYGKTAEYLMSRPISRIEIFNTKAVLVFLNIFILNLFAVVVGYVSIMVFRKGDFDVDAFLVVSMYTLLLNFLFGAMGLLISVIMKRARPVTSFCIALVMVFYFINTISRLSGVDGTFGYMSPFKWINVDVQSLSHGPEFSRLMAFLGFTLCFLMVSGLLYRRKDILT